MAAPKQVERQFQQVEDHYKQPAAAQQEAGKDKPADPATEVEDQTAETADAGEQDTSTSAADTTQGKQEEPAGEAKPTEAAPKDELAQLRQELEKAEQRHRTLSGMLRSKDDDLRQLQALVSQMEAAPPQAQQPETPSQPSASEKEDRENFGDDFVDMVHRVADAKLNGLMDRINRLEQQGNKVERVTHQTQQERFENRLAARVSDWREVDAMPEFSAWLQQSPTRVAFVQQAMQNFDADGIAEVFEQYKMISGMDSKGQAEESAPQPAPAESKLNRKVAPSKGRASTPAPKPEKKVWTRSEIAQVYRDRRKIPAKDFAEMERDIFNAQRENRVDFTK